MNNDKKDAERYRKLRALHWTLGSYVVTQIKNVQLGSDCLSESRLDEILDDLPVITEQPEPASSEPIPPEIQSRVSAMMRDAGMISEKPAWTPFWFEGNRWFDWVNTPEDWMRLKEMYECKPDSLTMQSILNSQNCPTSNKPKFGFAIECNGLETLRQFFEKHGMKW